MSAAGRGRAFFLTKDTQDNKPGTSKAAAPERDRHDESRGLSTPRELRDFQSKVRITDDSRDSRGLSTPRELRDFQSKVRITDDSRDSRGFSTPRELKDFQSKVRITDDEAPTSAIGSGRGFLLPSTSSESHKDKDKENMGVTKYRKRSGYRSPSPEPYRSKHDEPVKKRGNNGKPDETIANYMKLEVEDGRGVYTYDVLFNPQQEVRNLKIAMLKKHRSKIYKGCVFDGEVLCLPIRLPNDVTYFTSSHPITDDPVELKIVYKKKKSFSEMPSLFNILFKQVMTELKLVDFGRKYFNPDAANNIPEYHLEIWPGYVTSVIDLEGGVMLSLDISHRVLRSESILDHIKEIKMLKGDQCTSQLQRDIIGQPVITRYNYKIYIVEDIDFKSTPKSTFDKNGRSVSFLEYYQQTYNIKIRDTNQPLLIARTKREERKKDADKILKLIPELCCLTGLSDDMRNDFQLMKQVSSCMASTPEKRFAAVKKFVRNVNENPGAKEILNEWGMYINPNPVELDSRVLEPETIIFGKQKMHLPMNADWKQAVMKYPVLQPIDIENWAILHTHRDTKYTNNLVSNMLECTRSMGIRVAKPEIICLKSDSIDSYVRGLQNVINNDLDIVVCICPTMRDDRYAAIKRVCCVDNAIPSQVINSCTLGKKNADRIIKNIALQMNCKLGGSLWSVSVPLKNAMFVGIDTYHSGTSSKYKSVTALVASYNSHLTKWYSSVTIQRTGQEMSDNLEYAFSKALDHYYKFNDKYPEKIFIYRDGVGNNQLKMVEDYEINQMKACFKKIDPSYKPSMTVIIVQKRIMTRLYKRTKNGLENPRPGTVVDHTIVHKHLYDFFLVSHTSTRGVALPTHYIVIEDTSGLTPDEIQKLSYKLCHLYFNWGGTIRNPAPCQYAHKLCNLVGESIQQDIHHTLCDKLFYL